MNEKNCSTVALLTFGLAMSVGPSVGGFFIGKAIERFKTHDRTVVVKGLSEREVKADLSVWVINLKNSGSDLVALEQKTRSDKEALVEFLKAQGFKDEEIGEFTARVTDKYAREYGGDTKEEINRYIIEATLKIRTSEVDKVTQAMGQLSDLIKKGVIVSGEPNFYFTKFPELRPQMIAEATQSARQAALQFANDSGATVGHIRTANQGAFSIRGKDSYGEDNDYSEVRSPEKKIRVVSTVTFNLEK